MKLYEINNEEWEESIKYYYSSKKEYSKELFLNTVKNKEEIELDLTKFQSVTPYINLDLDDFFIKKIQIDLKEASIYLIIDEWNFKIIFIEITIIF
ncbi:hypothetical protein FJQ98_11440 [Lysinibacillus agricola]|uniref:Uncharacterized protein n=1 Tax=Lysinibacillus agricola TaxID=2590012 RepID=A0ABX7AXV8_9BACI|nr:MULTISPECIES: hypothetical protein [Lysinibacillus]KOS60270.1 hypothetical protein AN161_24565 [Lysinibacillus sp. FJAT-14222]QQP14560.1 hypothetical protein FJQ98_11440 [Lysinibacillus agricola]